MSAASRYQNPMPAAGHARSSSLPRERAAGSVSRRAPDGVEPTGRIAPMTEPDRWCLVVPVKRLALAKTRLAAVAGRHRTDLALAFALDTVEAALGCDLVRAVVAVTDEPDAATALAAARGARRRRRAGRRPEPGARPRRGGCPRGASGHAGSARCRPTCLRCDRVSCRAALMAAAGHDASFVRDAAGDGTTLLLARDGVAFEPQFGAGSARLHARAGARELAGDLPSLRRDVDTEGDLAVAAALGLGPARRARSSDASRPHESRLGWPTCRPRCAAIDPATPVGLGAARRRDELPYDGPALLGSGVRLLRSGQRVRIEVAGDRPRARVAFLTVATLPDRR